jgi:hypothetical protein
MLERHCRMCGREFPADASGNLLPNDLGGHPRRNDPDGELGPLCNGFFDETGERIDCYHRREWARAERFGRGYTEGRRARNAAEDMREAERSAKRKGRGKQLSLVRDDEQEGPPF